MELRELGDRLLRLHAKLLIGLLVAGVLAAVAVHLRDRPQYQADAQLVIGAQDPQNTAEAAALADTARGIATGPSLLARALAQAGASRDLVTETTAVDVQPEGSSGVLTLSVTDPDPRVAVKLANALAAGVVQTRRTLDQNGLVSSLRGLQKQEAATDAQIQKVSGRIASLAATLPPQTTGQSPALLQLNQLQARLTSLQDQATQLAVQRNDLIAQQGPAAAVTGKATTAIAIRGRGLLDVLIGGLLGLVAGIAAAAAREAMRPSLVGAAAISRAVGAPLLGEMNTPPDTWTLAALPDAGSYVELAADAQHVQEVRFAALDPQGRRGARVRMLEGPLGRLRFGPLAGRNLQPGELADGPDGDSPPVTGLVVATPRVLKLADVDALTNFIWISGWTLLGVLVYRPSRKRARGGRGQASQQHESSPSGQVEVDA